MIQYLKQAEIFSFLAMIFLFSVVVVAVKEYDLTQLKTQETQIRQDIQQARQDAAQLKADIAKANQATAQARQDFEQARAEAIAAKKEAEYAKQEVQRIKEQIRHLGPPIKILSESNQAYRFQSGKATISFDFRKAIENEILPWIERNNQETDCAFNAIEVIGHTDGVPVAPNQPNIDSEMISKYQSGQLEALRPGSNLDLGQMRALAVIAILQEYQQRFQRLPCVQFFFPYSAGQMLVNHRIAIQDSKIPDETRRRVEIRMLKYNPEYTDDSD